MSEDCVMRCGRCNDRYTGDVDSANVCDECFGLLEDKGLSLEEIVGEYPALGEDALEEDEEDE